MYIMCIVAGALENIRNCIIVHKRKIQQIKLIVITEQRR